MSIEAPAALSHDQLLAIAETWSFWGRSLPASVPRDIVLPTSLEPGRALVIQGVRRAGKSTLMQQLPARYGLPLERACFLNLEDPRLTNALTVTTLEHLVQAFAARHQDEAPLVFMLDEIQGVEGWERWLRSRLDRPGRERFVITGPNASLLSGELGATLTGRHLTVELYPFDFAEARRARPDLGFETWLHEGGFPAPLQDPDGDMLRRQYFHDIVERDLRERLAARSSRPIRQVVQMVFESAGSELSLRRIAAVAGIAVDTAASYLDAAEQAYLLFAVPFFAFSEAKRAARNRKYYPIDTGLRRVVVTPGGADRGKAFECAAQLALRRRFGDIYYWRGDGEVDFVVRDGARIIPIQVTWDGPAPRHERALDAFYEAFPQADEPVWLTADTWHTAALWQS